MAKPLNRETYRLVEWHLHRETLMRDVVRQYEREVLLSSRGTDYSEPVVKSGGAAGDPVSGKAFRLEEGTPEVRRARRWIRVIERTRRWFEGSTEGRLFDLYYGHTATAQLVAAAMGTDRRRVERLRDNVVYRAAMYALAERLYRLEGEDGAEKAPESGAKRDA